MTFHSKWIRAIPGAGAKPFINLVNRQTRRLVTAAQRDPVVADTFNRVVQLIARPSAMATPAMLLRIVRANRQRPDRVVITPPALTDEPARRPLHADHP